MESIGLSRAARQRAGGVRLALDCADHGIALIIYLNPFEGDLRMICFTGKAVDREKLLRPKVHFSRRAFYRFIAQRAKEVSKIAAYRRRADRIEADHQSFTHATGPAPARHIHLAGIARAEWLDEFDEFTCRSEDAGFIRNYVHLIRSIMVDEMPHDAPCYARVAATWSVSKVNQQGFRIRERSQGVRELSNQLLLTKRIVDPDDAKLAPALDFQKLSVGNAVRLVGRGGQRDERCLSPSRTSSFRGLRRWPARATLKAKPICAGLSSEKARPVISSMAMRGGWSSIRSNIMPDRTPLVVASPPPRTSSIRKDAPS